MKVILMANDKKLGKKDTIVDVADSYAANVLIPKKIAVRADNTNMNLLNQRIEKEKRNYAEALVKANKNKQQIEALNNLFITATCAKDGRMFGSITNKDIAAELVNHNIIVDKRDIILNQPIKELGEYNIKVKLFDNINATLKVKIKK